ncbi:MAG: hypothetical protein IT258_00970, partial [Saprospiraceae bacterium]|nr:hypothetical protein [Saprospiraceae bacterium]
MHKITITPDTCLVEDVGIVLGAPFDSILVGNFCYCPNNFIYADIIDDSTNLYKIDPQNAQVVGVIPLNAPHGNISGMVCDGNNVIHAVSNDASSTHFMEIIPETGATTILNTTNSGFLWDLVQYDSVWYAWSVDGMYRLDLHYLPFETELILPNSTYLYGGVGTVFPSQCNTFISQVWNGQSSDLVLTNLVNTSHIPLCPTNRRINGFTAVDGDYLTNDPYCTVSIDLDKNNNSGATGNNYNSAVFNCNLNGVNIADQDAFIAAYPIIDTMKVSITAGILDPGNERLFLGVPPTGIAVSGNFSTTITLTNASGRARVSDFLNSLKAILYRDLSLSPTGGIREIKVSFVTRNGFPTDTATCFVNVQQLPQVQVNLGPDQKICQGTTISLDAGNPGLSYRWLGGLTTQTINVSSSGTYKVTVSDGVNCPGVDEVKIGVLPNIAGSIEGPNFACAGDSISLIFHCNCTDTFNLRVLNNANLQDTITGVVDGMELRFFLPFNPNNTLYDLNFNFIQIITNQSTRCIAQLAHTVWVNPSNLIQNNNAFICQGDSINLGGIWQTQPGTYTHYETTPFGCGITIHTTLYVGMPGNQTIQINQTTCDPAMAGIFTQNLTNQGGCDSTVITTVNLLTNDTFFVASQTCDPTAVGVFTEHMTNSAGCDSTVVTTITLAPNIFVGFQLLGAVCQGDSVGITFDILGPGAFDFTLTDLNSGQIETLHDISYGDVHFVSPSQSALYWPQQVVGTNPEGCLKITNLLPVDVIQPVFTENEIVLCNGDSIFLANAWQTQSGNFVDSLNSQFGCDSIVNTHLVILDPIDTVFLASQTCDPTLAGVFTENLTNLAGCDSTIITTIELLSSDTFYIASHTCDPALTGVFTENLTNSVGCDSTVITTVSLLSSDTVILASQTCDPALAGIFTQNLTNSAGCDSTIITTISLLSSDTVFIASQTCNPTLAGIFTQNLTNSAGCDSTVITTVALLSSDTVYLASQTCDPALAGVFTENLTNSAGCDSTIITAISLFSSDSVFLTSQTCDPTLVGVFTENLSNSVGCDSTVITTVALISSDTVFLASQTCDPLEVGVFEEILINQFGCDSLVLLTVSLLPPDSCEIEEVTGLKVYAPNAFSP